MKTPNNFIRNPNKQRFNDETNFSMQACALSNSKRVNLFYQTQQQYANLNTVSETQIEEKIIQESQPIYMRELKQN